MHYVCMHTETDFKHACMHYVCMHTETDSLSMHACITFACTVRLLACMHISLHALQAKSANLHACCMHALNYRMHAFILHACTRTACMLHACTLCMHAHACTAGKKCQFACMRHAYSHACLHACTTCMQHACNSLEGNTCLQHQNNYIIYFGAKVSAKSGRISFLDMLSAVPPFLLRRKCSQSTNNAEHESIMIQ